jgi:hypothetical protein
MINILWQQPHDSSYLPPEENVLLVTCMDMRLLDNIVQFMNHDNLINRYDHVVFAGAALGALGAPGVKRPDGSDYSQWRICFFDHLRSAVDLHDIKDVYILEHRNCGAYHKVFKVCKDFDHSEAEQVDENNCHFKYASMLERDIKEWSQKNNVPLGIYKFIMDLRGRVTQLVEIPTAAKKAKGKK